MLRYIFKGKREIKQANLVMERSCLEYRKTIFFKRYITLVCILILSLIYIDGDLTRSQNWLYYFQLNKGSQIEKSYPLSVPQPFNEKDVIAYAKSVAYKLLAITPLTQKKNYDQVFSNNFYYNFFIKDVKDHIDQSGLLSLVKDNNWYFSIESIGEPSVKTAVVKIKNKPSYAWQVTFKNFILFGRSSSLVSKTKGDLVIKVVKTPFINNPSQLSVISIFLENFEDIGSDYGY